MGKAKKEEKRQKKAQEKLKAKYTMTVEAFNAKIRREVLKGRDDLINQVVANDMAVCLKVLSDVFGFGPGRIKRFMGAYNSTFDKVAADELDLNMLKAEALNKGALLEVKDD